MSQKSERLSDAIGEIRDEFVIEAHSAPNKRPRRIKAWVLAAACVGLLAACLLTGFLVARNIRRNPATSDVGGDIEHIHSDSGKYVAAIDLFWKPYTPASGIRRAEVLFPYTDVSDTAVRIYSSSASTDTVVGVTVEYANGENVNGELGQMMAGFVGQWFYSLLSYDYEAHFAMFPQEMITERFIKEVEKRNMDYDQAMTAIRENAAILVPFDCLALKYTVSDCHEMTDGEVSDYLIGLGWMWEDAGIDMSEIDGWLFCRYKSDIRIGRRLRMDAEEEGSAVLFRYRNVWYMSPEHMDDDISIDLATASPERSGYFEPYETCVAVVWREDNLLFLNDGTVVFCPELANEIAAGSFVSAKGVRGLGYRVFDLNVGEESKWATVRPASEVTLLSEIPQDPGDNDRDGFRE